MRQEVDVSQMSVMILQHSIQAPVKLFYYSALLAIEFRRLDMYNVNNSSSMIGCRSYTKLFIKNPTPVHSNRRD